MPEREGSAGASAYGRIAAQLAELLVPELDLTARMATAAALLHHKRPRFSWTGFYRLVDGELLVGPYQGLLACAILKPRGSGVCWTAVERGETVIVPDIHAFPGHIACDGRARSEIVVPLRDASGAVFAVLDVDSTEPGAFDETDARGLEAIVELILSRGR
ncbi:MAG TPA: GAF domain-containing protein [Polyangia bacterium]|nr:GAF domain-containing protein [Polyangia bacterium]